MIETLCCRGMPQGHRAPHSSAAEAAPLPVRQAAIRASKRLMGKGSLGEKMGHLSASNVQDHTMPAQDTNGCGACEKDGFLSFPAAIQAHAAACKWLWLISQSKSRHATSVLQGNQGSVGIDPVLCATRYIPLPVQCNGNRLCPRSNSIGLSSFSLLVQRADTGGPISLSPHSKLLFMQRLKNGQSQEVPCLSSSGGGQGTAACYIWVTGGRVTG